MDTGHVNRFTSTLCSVFGSSSAQGNLVIIVAGEVEAFERMEVAKQAAEMGVTTIVYADTSCAPYHIRFATPKGELSFCGHGTLAAGSVLTQSQGQYPLRLYTAAGMQVDVFYHDGHASLSLEADPHLEFCVDWDELLPLLGLCRNDLATEFPMCMADAGSPKWLVPVRQREVLAALCPEPEPLADYSQRLGVNGAYVYTLDVDGLIDPDGPVNVLARSFNPKTGNPEDAATGAAAVALGFALSVGGVAQTPLIIGQGVKLREINRLQVSVLDGRCAYLSGKVVILGDSSP